MRSRKPNVGSYIPLYWDDFVGGTTSFGAEEIGAYLLLLGHQWEQGYIENDPTIIERVSRCEYGKLPRVLAKFKIGSDGHLRNMRMVEIRAQRKRVVARRHHAAKIRWENAHADAFAKMQMHMQNDADDSQHADNHSVAAKNDAFASPSREKIYGFDADAIGNQQVATMHMHMQNANDSQGSDYATLPENPPLSFNTINREDTDIYSVNSPPLRNTSLLGYYGGGKDRGVGKENPPTCSTSQQFALTEGVPEARRPDIKPRSFQRDEPGWINVRASDIRLWKTVAPAVDIERTLVQAWLWCRDNGARGVKRNYRRFLTNWITRHQERGGDRKASPPKTFGRATL